MTPRNESDSLGDDTSENEEAIEQEESQVEASRPTRSLREKTSELWHQKPGPRETTNQPRKPIQDIVNGLDHREYVMGWFAAILELAIAVVYYLAARHSANIKTRHDAPVYLIAFLVGFVLLALGTILRRRALLGFGSFLVGLEILSYASPVLGLVFLGFGFWLILRVMRKQRADRELAGPVVAKKVNTSTRAPAASKRYTPPRNRPPGAPRR